MSLILDQYQLDHSSAFLGDLYGNRWASQTFQAGYSAPLKEIKLYGYKNGTPAEDFTVELRNVVTAKPGSTIHATTTIPVGDFTGAEAEVTAIFSTPYTLISGTDYAIVCYQNGGTTGNSYEVRNAPNDTAYTNGTYHYSADGGSNWTQQGQDLYFKTYVEIDNTLWLDINCDIRVGSAIDYNDINCDIRVVSSYEVLRDINCNIITAKEELYDLNCDIRVLDEYEKLYDINCDIRVLTAPLQDINCDIRVCQEGGEFPGFLPDIDCDIRVLSRNLYDINADIRVQATKSATYDINTDIRVISANGVVSPTPGIAKMSPKAIGLTGFRVYLNSVEIVDVALDSIQWNWTVNEAPASASFRIIRKSDNFNKTLADVAQAINTNTPIEIKFDGNLRYYGYIMDLDVENNGESVIVNCLDRKHKVQEKLYSISYGRKWDFPEPGELDIVIGDYATTGLAITYLLDQLVTDGIIASYSGVPTGIIVEYQDIQDMPAGALLTELLDLSGNYYWNITPNNILEIYESGTGTIKSLPVQEINRQFGLYDVLNYNFKLNNRNNLITTLEVTMGTESEEERASFRVVNVGTPNPAWTGSSRLYDTLTYSYDQKHLAGFWIDIRRRLQLWKRANPEKAKEVGTKWRISNWTDGSFIDNTFKPYVIGFNNYKISGWSWGGEYLRLSQPLVKVKRVSYSFSQGGPSWLIHVEKEFKIPRLVGRFYKKEIIAIADIPSIFDIDWIGIGGAGSKRKVTFSQLGVRDSIGWTAYEEDSLVAKSEPGYDDTNYATDRANLILSKINDPITEGNIDLTFDAFEYYGLKLGNKINLSGTSETDIYSNNNGFPLDITSINFNAGSYIVTLNVKHIRDFKATKNFR